MCAVALVATFEKGYVSVKVTLTSPEPRTVHIVAAVPCVQLRSWLLQGSAT
jgi:hypothetical protein